MVMVKGREVIADSDDHHNQPHSLDILVCVFDCDDDHWSHKTSFGIKSLCCVCYCLGVCVCV